MDPLQVSLIVLVIIAGIVWCLFRDAC